MKRSSDLNGRGAAGARILIVGAVVLIGIVVAVRLASVRPDRNESGGTKQGTSTPSIDAGSKSPTGKRTLHSGTSTAAGGTKARRINRRSRTANAVTSQTDTTKTTTTLSKEELAEQKRDLDKLVARYQRQTDPDKRDEIAGDLSDIEHPDAIDALISFLKEEKDADVRDTLRESLAQSDALDMEGSKDKVLTAVQDMYPKAAGADEQISNVDLAAALETKAAVKFLFDLYLDAKTDPKVKSTVAEDLQRLRAKDMNLVEEQIAVRIQLEQRAQATPTP